MIEARGSEREDRVLHLVVDGAGDASWNLAVDEALLADQRAWLRLYSWAETSISLGYFQRWRDFEELAARHPIVRRPSGGAAIAHGPGELTIATALPENWLPAGAEGANCWLNRCVQAALRSLGVELAAGTAAVETRRERWCFVKASRLDLADRAGDKAFGSAQRRREGRILQHGSLVLEAPSVGCATGCAEVDREALIAALIKEALRSLDAQPEAHRDLPGELLEASEGHASRHRSRAWLERR